MPGKREREIERERWGGRGNERGKRWKDKLLLHHVFIRYDLGSHNGGAEDKTGEEPHYKLKVNVRSISHGGPFMVPLPAVVLRSVAALLDPNEMFLLKLITLGRNIVGCVLRPDGYISYLMYPMYMFSNMR